MRQEIGEKVKFLRQKKGYSQGEYAIELGQSKTYISNVESGKSKSIYFHILEELEKEGLFSPGISSDSDERSFRLDRAIKKYQELKSKDEKAAEYLLSNFENGLALLLSKTEGHQKRKKP
jgi:transcriptional regulator with XRE-family HTH domain